MVRTRSMKDTPDKPSVKEGGVKKPTKSSSTKKKDSVKKRPQQTKKDVVRTEEDETQEQSDMEVDGRQNEIVTEKEGHSSEPESENEDVEEPEPVYKYKWVRFRVCDICKKDVQCQKKASSYRVHMHRFHPGVPTLKAKRKKGEKPSGQGPSEGQQSPTCHQNAVSIETQTETPVFVDVGTSTEDLIGSETHESPLSDDTVDEISQSPSQADQSVISNPMPANNLTEIETAKASPYQPIGTPTSQPSKSPDKSTSITTQPLPSLTQSTATQDNLQLAIPQPNYPIMQYPQQNIHSNIFKLN